MPKLFRITCLTGMLLLGLASVGRAQTTLEVTDPKFPGPNEPALVSAGVLELTFTSSADVKKVRILVRTANDSSRAEVTLDANQRETTQSINLLEGKNTLELLGFKEGDKQPSVRWARDVACSGKKCGATTTSGGVQQQSGSGGQGQADNVTIKTEGITDGEVNTYFSVKKPSNITKLNVAVYGPDDRLIDSKSPLHLVQVGDALIVNAKLKVISGKNLIRVLDADNKAEKASWAFAEVDCSALKDACSPTTSGPKPSQVGLLRIHSPAKSDKPYNVINQKTVPVEVKLSAGSPTTKLKVKVINADVLVPQKPESIDVPADAGIREKTIEVKIAKGLNRIIVSDADNEAAQIDSVEINCEGNNCGKDPATNKLAVVVSAVKDGETYRVTDASSVDSLLTVPKGDIKEIEYEVRNGRDAWRFGPKAVDASEKAVTVPLNLKLVRGLNTIRIYDLAHPGGENDVSVMINCVGENCPSDLNVATIVTNSQNTRVIAGLEQAGASSTNSETKPFLDLFFTTPIIFDRAKTPDFIATTEYNSNGEPVMVGDDTKVVWIKRSKLSNGDELVSTAAYNAAGEPMEDGGKPKLVWIRKSTLPSSRAGAPRAGFWGNIRLSSTPQQLTTTGVLPSNLSNLVADSAASGKLVQSFDFLAGLEYRLFTANGSFLSLIPGIKQKTRFYLAGGVGSISPLDATQEAPKFFLIPGTDSTQRSLFERRYGIPPTTATHIAIVPLDRDRFLRQWFAGIRLKTHYCDRYSETDGECHSFRNSFPGVFDLMIGQSESVTGGTFKRTEVDPLTGASKTKQAFVFRVDGFYPLPIREASFIYFYGTAVMKLGGSPRLDNFLVLESASANPNINSPLTYVPPVEFLKNLQSNRDYYKIGVGINLTDFFNRNKPK